MLSVFQNIREVVQGPEPVRWTSELYGTDTEFRLAMEDGVPAVEIKRVAERAGSKTEFREKMLDAYYGQF